MLLLACSSISSRVKIPAMKFAVLRSIGHNIANSLASRMGELIGVYEMDDIFDAAARSPEGYVEVDFIAGTATDGQISASLSHVIRLYAEALDRLCESQGVPTSAFRQLTARYSRDRWTVWFAVTVVDRNGRRATDDYRGVPGARPKVLDHLGRIRRR